MPDAGRGAGGRSRGEGLEGAGASLGRPALKMLPQARGLEAGAGVQRQEPRSRRKRRRREIDGKESGRQSENRQRCHGSGKFAVFFVPVENYLFFKKKKEVYNWLPKAWWQKGWT